MVAQVCDAFFGQARLAADCQGRRLFDCQFTEKGESQALTVREEEDTDQQPKHQHRPRRALKRNGGGRRVRQPSC